MIRREQLDRILERFDRDRIRAGKEMLSPLSSGQRFLVGSEDLNAFELVRALTINLIALREAIGLDEPK